MLTLILVIIN